MSSSYLVNVPKLKGRENYDEWAFAVKNFLILEGLKKYVTEEPDVTITKEVDDDEKTKAKLILTIDPSLYVHVKEATTSKSLWSKLQAMFDDSGFARRISLLRNLISTRLESCDSMVQYVNQIIETSQKLRGTGFNIDDEWIGSLLLAGLPDKYMPMLMAIEHSGIMITADSIKSKLIDMEGDVGKAGSALYVKHRSADSNRGSSRSTNQSVKSSKRQDTKSEVRCFKCKKVGHYRNKCPLNSDSQSQNKTENAFSAVFLTGGYSKSDWYVDSGASSHVVVEKQLFTSMKSCEVQDIMVANKSLVKVKDIGDVKLKSVVNNEIFDITVKNALYVPEVATNLLSVSKLIENGNRVSFVNDCCKIFNRNNDLIAIAELVGGVYKLKVQRVQNENCLLTVTSDVWHRRLGHINDRDFERMKNGAVLGLSCLDKNKKGFLWKSISRRWCRSINDEFLILFLGSGEARGLTMREEELEVALKVVIVGNGGVGKSSMIQRYCKGVFTKDYKKTIGVDFLERQIEVDGEDVRLMLWDTAGQEEFDAITKAYYRGAQACVLAFSTTDRDSFEAAHSWKLKVENECGEIPTVIVQNKIDLLDQSVVNPEEVDLLARALGCKLIRTSVKEDLNVATVFRHLASKCLAELHDTHDFDYITAPIHHHLPNSLTISAFSPSHSSKNQNNGTIVLRPNKNHKKKKNVLKNACKIL